MRTRVYRCLAAVGALVVSGLLGGCILVDDCGPGWHGGGGHHHGGGRGGRHCELDAAYIAPQVCDARAPGAEAAVGG